MFERPQAGERAILVYGGFQAQVDKDDLDEFKELASSAQVEIVGVVSAGRRDKPDAKYLIGSGKVEQVRELVAAECAEVVLFNHTLSPSQERNLEASLHCRVLDRTGLILDIFAQRARSFEGKLQVELAQLRHLATRLVRGWTHLERQKGGIGLRGPGETQLETDRRLLGLRIKYLNKRLSKVTRQRNQGRASRNKAAVPSVSLVGYTNAGKSTLFNALTGAQVYAQDQLFATLDPTIRRIEVEKVGTTVLADTVGFIQDLPHELIAAFRATLQEVSEAQLLLHVIDASSPQHQLQINEVNKVLVEIGAEDVPQIEIYNKIDCLNEPARIERNEAGEIRRIWLSAQSGEGLGLLTEALQALLHSDIVRTKCNIPLSRGALRARLYEVGEVLSEQITVKGEWLMTVRMTHIVYSRLISGGEFDATLIHLD